MRGPGLAWIAVWGVYLAYLARVGLDLINFGGGPSDLFWYELLTTLVGLAAGVLALAGLAIWRWPALASSIVFIGVVYYAWGTLPDSWQEIVGAVRESDPLRLFHLMVMPIAAAALAVVAGWRIIPRGRFS
jgi:hypothetical protein